MAPTTRSALQRGSSSTLSSISPTSSSSSSPSQFSSGRITVIQQRAAGEQFNSTLLNETIGVDVSVEMEDVFLEVSSTTSEESLYNSGQIPVSFVPRPVPRVDQSQGTSGGGSGGGAPGRIRKQPRPKRTAGMGNRPTPGMTPAARPINNTSTKHSPHHVQLSCPKSAFKRIVRDILDQHPVSSNDGGSPTKRKIQGQALDVLQEAAETHLTTLLFISGLLAKHSRRKGIKIQDFQLAHQIYDIDRPPQHGNGNGPVLPANLPGDGRYHLRR